MGYAAFMQHKSSITGMSFYRSIQPNDSKNNIFGLFSCNIQLLKLQHQCKVIYQILVQVLKLQTEDKVAEQFFSSIKHNYPIFLNRVWKVQRMGRLLVSCFKTTVETEGLNLPYINNSDAHMT